MNVLKKTLQWTFYLLGSYCVCLALSTMCTSVTASTIATAFQVDYEKKSSTWTEEVCDSTIDGRGKTACWDVKKTGVVYVSDDPKWDSFLNGRNNGSYSLYLSPWTLGAFFVWATGWLLFLILTSGPVTRYGDNNRAQKMAAKGLTWSEEQRKWLKIEEDVQE